MGCKGIVNCFNANACSREGSIPGSLITLRLCAKIARKEA